MESGVCFLVVSGVDPDPVDPDRDFDFGDGHDHGGRVSAISTGAE